MNLLLINPNVQDGTHWCFSSGDFTSTQATQPMIKSHFMCRDVRMKRLWKRQRTEDIFKVGLLSGEVYWARRRAKVPHNPRKASVSKVLPK